MTLPLTDIQETFELRLNFHLLQKHRKVQLNINLHFCLCSVGTPGSICSPLWGTCFPPAQKMLADWDPAHNSSKIEVMCNTDDENTHAIILYPGWNTVRDKSNPTYQLILESVTFLQPQWTLAGILVISQGGTGCIAVVLEVLNLWLFRKNFDTVISIKPK